MKCNHAIGLIHFEYPEHKSEFAYVSQVQAKREFYDECLLEDVSVKFKHCPDCGESLNKTLNLEFIA